MQDYFSLLDLPRSFDIDMTLLQQRYFDAQRKSHPDKMRARGAQERQSAILQSMLANEAYDALKSPLSRARHMLALQGIEVDKVKPPPELLMEVMEAREALMEAQDLNQVQVLEESCARQREGLMGEISTFCTNKQWQRAAEQTSRLSYLLKLEEEIRIRKKGLTENLEKRN